MKPLPTITFTRHPPITRKCEILIPRRQRRSIVSRICRNEGLLRIERGCNPQLLLKNPLTFELEVNEPGCVWPRDFGFVLLGFGLPSSSLLLWLMLIHVHGVSCTHYAVILWEKRRGAACIGCTNYDSSGCMSGLVVYRTKATEP